MNFKYMTIFAILAFSSSAMLFAAPPVTTGLQLWLDAGNQSSITAADGVLNNNDRISGWKDILVGDNIAADNAIQSSEADQPIWIAAVPDLNNLPAVRFDGVRNYLNSSTLNIGANTTIFIVCRNAIQKSGGSWHRAILAADNDPFRESGDGYGISISKGDVSPAAIYAGLAEEGYVPDVVESSLAQDYSYGIIALKRDGGASDGTQLYRYGVEDTNYVLLGSTIFYRTSDFHTGYDLGGTPLVHMVSGSDSPRFYYGDIAEVLIYDRKLEDFEFKSVSSYLAKKYFKAGACGGSLIEYNATDINHDCRVNLKDLAILAQNWMGCTRIDDSSCVLWMPSAMAQEKWNTWRKSWNTFPIGAWAFFQIYQGTLAEYQTYANANLTMVQTPLGVQMNNAIAAGLRPFIGCWEQLYLNKTKLQYYVNYQKSTDANVFGYPLMDEPVDVNTMKLLGNASQYIYYNDLRDALPMVNLKPSYGTLTNFADFTDYITKYIENATPAVLMYDHYPILADGTDRASFYSDMEIIRQKSLDAGIGFIGFALATSFVDTPVSTRQPSESDLNWEVYSLITYGAKGIWYYVYRIDPAQGLGYGTSMVTHDTGTPTITYTMAGSINAELKAMGPVLMKLDSKGVWHTGGSIPSGATSYSNGVISVISNFTGDNFILSKSINMDNAADVANYVMVMNKRHSASTTSSQNAANAVFTASPTSLKVYKYNTTNKAWDLQTGSGGTYTINIAGGKMALLKFSTN
jgi:hypothetical protein